MFIYKKHLFFGGENKLCIDGAGFFGYAALNAMFVSLDIMRDWVKYSYAIMKKGGGNLNDCWLFRRA